MQYRAPSDRHGFYVDIHVSANWMLHHNHAYTTPAGTATIEVWAGQPLRRARLHGL